MVTGIVGTSVGVANAEAQITTFNRLFIPGTWETDADPTRPTGALAAVAREIEREHGDSATIYFLPYMARAFDNGRTYADSKATAIANASKVLAARAEADPDLRFTITGYSQGADAAGDLTAAIGNGKGPAPADRVVAVGLLADPGTAPRAANGGPDGSWHRHRRPASGGDGRAVRSRDQHLSPCGSLLLDRQEASSGARGSAPS